MGASRETGMSRWKLPGLIQTSLLAIFVNVQNMEWMEGASLVWSACWSPTSPAKIMACSTVKS